MSVECYVVTLSVTLSRALTWLSDRRASLGCMPEGRPPMPRELQRALLVEAGHRCAIPTCRTVAPLQFEHIEDWARVREHKFENMIVLCANCHARKGDGPGQIDRKSLRQYKANLGVVNGRYGDIERRVLTLFASDPTAQRIQMPGGSGIALMYLVLDGLLVKVPTQGVANIRSVGGAGPAWEAIEHYMITPGGREFVKRWVAAQPVSAEAETSAS